MAELRIYGVRHHGPGSARALLAALEAFGPDVLLVEGPADCDAALPLVAHEGLRPPVALLLHRTDAPGDGIYYPFAEFSPEWQALRFASKRGIPARFVDLPGALQLGPARGDLARAPEDDVTLEGPAVRPGARPIVEDPLGELARASGEGDGEDWWEEHVERGGGRGGEEVFHAIREAMGALREDEVELEPSEARREAHMREGLRAAERDGFRRIAVVCGAWHTPALARGEGGALRVAGSARSDQALLRRLGRTKIAWTWIPWSHERLLARSGYGAGIESPGYYQHLFQRGERATAVWLTRAVRLLRGEDLEASSASVIDAVRLAETLAGLRGRRSPGLDELQQALLAVICQGEGERLELVRQRLEVGNVLGEVPAELGTLPIQRDLEREQRRLRLRPSAERRALELDLRRELDRGRSELLHRLAVLRVAWGEPIEVPSAGSFKEPWSLEWRPELALALVDAHARGPTVARAAEVELARQARRASLPQLLELAWKAVRAGLPHAVSPLVVALERKAALASDARILFAALPPLLDLAKWGDARGAAGGSAGLRRPGSGSAAGDLRASLAPLARAVLARASLALPTACRGLDDGAARELGAAVRAAARALEGHEELPARGLFVASLREVLTADSSHGLLRGVALRLLHDARAVTDEEGPTLALFALSSVRGGGVSRAAAFLDGLVVEGGAALLHDQAMFAVVDGWLAGLDADAFRDALPLVRRSFATFSAGERRLVAARVAEGTSVPRVPEPSGLDEARAARVLPVLAALLAGPASAGAEEPT